MGSRKAKLWDVYVERWRAKTKRCGRTAERGLHGAVRARRTTACTTRAAEAPGRTSSGLETGRDIRHVVEHQGSLERRGCFFGPHHLQQSDRYLENALESRTRHVTPYPWGFRALEIDRDLAQQSKFALRRGERRDARRHAVRHARPTARCRAPIDVPEGAAGQLVWLTAAGRAPRTRARSARQGAESASRYVATSRRSSIRPRTACRGGDRGRPSAPRASRCARRRSRASSACRSRGFSKCATRRIVFDENFAPPVLIVARPIRSSTAGSTASSAGSTPSSTSWRATPPTRPPAAACRASTISCCRCSTARSRCSSISARSHYVHPERLYEELLRHRRRARDLRHAGAAGARIRRLRPRRPRDASFEPVLRDIQDFLAAQPRSARDPPRPHRARAQRLRLDDPRPHAVPQRDLRARGLGAPAADARSSSSSGPVQGRPEHQDERDRPGASAGRRAGASADAAAADPRHHRSRLFLSRPHVAAVAGIQRRQRASACISPATGRSCSLICGRSWKTGDERQRRSVRPRRADDHPPQPGRTRRADARAAAAAAGAAARLDARPPAPPRAVYAAAYRRRSRAPGAPAADPPPPTSAAAAAAGARLGSDWDGWMPVGAAPSTRTRPAPRRPPMTPAPRAACLGRPRRRSPPIR